MSISAKDFLRLFVLAIVVGLGVGFGRAAAMDHLGSDEPVKVVCTTTTEDLTGGKVSVSTDCKIKDGNR